MEAGGAARRAGRPESSAVEQLLSERVALCWLDYHHQEYRDARAQDRTYQQADFDARWDRAHRRYLAALKALAAVRKLPIVAVQVNLGAESGVAVPAAVAAG